MELTEKEIEKIGGAREERRLYKEFGCLEKFIRGMFGLGLICVGISILLPSFPETQYVLPGGTFVTLQMLERLPTAYPFSFYFGMALLAAGIFGFLFLSLYIFSKVSRFQKQFLAEHRNEIAKEK